MNRRNDAELSDADYRRLAAFRHGLRVFLRFSEEAARDQGVTPNQHQLMLSVRGWPGPAPPTISDLADQLQLRLHSTSELARRAEAAGLVVLRTDAEDHRRQQVELTTSGRQTLAALSVLHRQELRRFRTHFAELLDTLEE
jgi:DNA-binding MarR family transcriptional regulator